jgi:flagellar export protein FliJ
MTKQTRLKTILDFITKQEEEAARQLSIWLQKETNAQLQITQLQQYSQEYLNEKAERINIHQIQNQQHFLTKLSSAIEQQKALLPELEKEIDTYKKTWQKVKSQREGLDKIMQKYQIQAQKQEERQLQIDLDAYAARKN